MPSRPEADSMAHRAKRQKVPAVEPPAETFLHHAHRSLRSLPVGKGRHGVCSASPKRRRPVTRGQGETSHRLA